MFGKVSELKFINYVQSKDSPFPFGKRECFLGSQFLGVAYECIRGSMKSKPTGGA